MVTQSTKSSAMTTRSKANAAPAVSMKCCSRAQNPSSNDSESDSEVEEPQPVKGKCRTTRRHVEEPPCDPDSDNEPPTPKHTCAMKKQHVEVVDDELDSIEEVVNEIPDGADEEVADEVSTSVLEINKRLTLFI